jgi:hypothetical protein
VITGSKWAHRELIKSRNLGTNQARSQRSSANAAAAIKTPDAATDIFLGQLLSTDPMNRFYPSRNDRASRTLTVQQKVSLGGPTHLPRKASHLSLSISSIITSAASAFWPFTGISGEAAIKGTPELCRQKAIQIR